MFQVSGGWGIPLQDALAGDYIGLLGPDDAVFKARVPSVVVQLEVTPFTLSSKLVADLAEF